MVDGKEYTDGYASFDIGGSVRPYGCRGMFPARTAGAAGGLPRPAVGALDRLCAVFGRIPCPVGGADGGGNAGGLPASGMDNRPAGRLAAGDTGGGHRHLGRIVLHALGIGARSLRRCLFGEMLHDRTDNARAFRVAFGSFLAFVLGTGLKLVVSLLMTFAIVKAVLF